MDDLPSRHWRGIKSNKKMKARSIRQSQKRRQCSTDPQERFFGSPHSVDAIPPRNSSSRTAQQFTGNTGNCLCLQIVHNPPLPYLASGQKGVCLGIPSLPGLLAGSSWATLTQQKNAAGVRRPQIKLDILGTFEGRSVVAGSSCTTNHNRQNSVTFTVRLVISAN